MTIPLVVPSQVLSDSLRILQEVGRTESECVVLWLGRRIPQAVEVLDVYKPEQIASADFFTIPRSSIAALFEELRQRNLMVAAQLHTHPEEAFHSVADNRWAIVRHVGALSLVLPTFAQNTTTATFFQDVAIYRLSAENEWEFVRPVETNEHVRGGP